MLKIYRLRGNFGIILFLFLLQIIFYKNASAKPQVPSYLTKLTLENTPQIGEIAQIKLEVTATFDKQKVDIGCFLPEGLELIRDSQTRIISSQPFVSPEKGESIVFYSGPMKNSEKKEFIFRVRVLDGRKYIISAGAVGLGDYLEIDLGEPEPPLPEQSSTNLTQSKVTRVSNLVSAEGKINPLRTELKIRTKDKPYILPPYNPQDVPLRYLVYSEEEAKELEITLELPEGLELLNTENYRIAILDKEGRKFKIVKLFQGQLRFKQSKAFYFNLRADREEHFRIKAEAKIFLSDGREFVSEDYQDIELGAVRY